MDLLALAFYLSVLSYCLGLLLRAIPLPFFGIKKLGRSLVTESIFSCVLVFSYRFILFLIEYLGSVLGSNWGYYTIWLAERTSILLALITILKAIGIILGKIGLGFLTDVFISQIAGLLSTSLTTLLATSIVSSIIYTSSYILIAIGIVLHAVPFKLTRNVGATIIAITIVFSVGLPLMPSFIGVLYTTPFQYLDLSNVCEANLTLIDASDNVLGQAVLEGYISEELVYKYKFNEQGKLNIYKYQGFPCGDHTIKLDIVGNRYRATIRNTGSPRWNLTIRVPDIISITTNRFIRLSTSMEIINITRNGCNLTIIVRTSNTQTIRVFTEADDIHYLYINNSQINPVEVNNSIWYGVNFTTYFYSVPSGVHIIEVTLNYETKTPLNVDTYPYVIRSLNIDPLAPENILYYATFLFMELTVLPLVYIAILFTISLNVARLIGGASTSLARIVVYP